MSAGVRRRPIPPPVEVPVPPVYPAGLDPLECRWPAGVSWWCCYDANWGPRHFSAGDVAHRGGFHLVTPAGAAGPLGVLYGADDLDGALSEPGATKPRAL